MDPSSTALARRTGGPYRSSSETSLEERLRRGAFAPVRHPWLSARVGFLAGFVALSLVVFGLDGAAPLLGALGLVGLVIVCARAGGAFLPKSASLAALRASVESYPIPVLGVIASWLDAGELWFGSFNLVFREQHPWAEATVRLAEPDARLEWREPATLHVELLWNRDGRDLLRLDRLVALLSAYRDELTLEHLELGSTYRIAEPIRDKGR